MRLGVRVRRVRRVDTGLLSTDRVELQLDIKQLLHRNVRIPTVRLERPTLNLETGRNGGNWVFGDPNKPSDLQFRGLWVNDGHLEFLDPPKRTDVTVDVASAAAKPGQPAPLTAKGRGHWNGNPFTLYGTAESPLQLKDRDAPYHIDMHATAGRTSAHARGSLLDPLQLRDFDLQLAIAGQNMDDLFPLLGLALPPTPPYALDGKLTRDIVLDVSAATGKHVYEFKKGRRMDHVNVPHAVRPFADRVVAATDAVCLEHLDVEYASLCRSVVGKLPARALRRTGRRRPDGDLSGERRIQLLHRTGDERLRRDGDALMTDRTLAMSDDSVNDRAAATEVPGHPAGAAALSFRDVSMVFPDGTHALQSTSFDVHAGEFVTVVGPSGCGKSTLLRIASGLNRPTTGHVDVDKTSLGYVFQDATLLQWRSVLRNVELLAELEGVSKAERRRRAEHAIELVGLTGSERKYPKQLSGGMKMRASLARSLVLDPSVFLFDEPFGAVDEITRERLNDEVLSLFQRQGFAALFITHSISEAVFLSTRVVVMSSRPGHIVGDFEVPFAYPRSPELRFEPAFAELCGKISHTLRGAHT